MADPTPHVDEKPAADTTADVEAPAPAPSSETPAAAPSDDVPAVAPPGEPPVAPPGEPPAAPPADRGTSREERRAKWWAETKLDLKFASVIMFVALLLISGATWTPWREPLDGTEDLRNVTHAFFSQGEYAPDHPSALDGAPKTTGAGSPNEPGLVIPFELLSVLLLAALVAGVVIALREREGGP